MSQTATRQQELRELADEKFSNLAADAVHYLQAYLQLKDSLPESDEHRQASINVHMAVTLLKTHSGTVLEVLDAAFDALPDDDE